MNDAEAVELLRELVSIPSPSGDEAQVAEFLARRLALLGFDTSVDGAGNVVARLGPTDAALEVALVGHIDTVPGSIPVRLADGVLHGRGAVDAKGPLAAFVAAACRFAGESSGRLRVLLAGCVEEEAPSSAGARHLMKRPAPDLLVVGEPSGWDGVTLGYKGYLRARASFSTAVAHGAHDATTSAERACEAWQAVQGAARAFDRQREGAFERLLATLVSVATDGDGLRERTVLDIALRLPPDLAPGRAEAWLRRLTHGSELEVLGALPAWSGPRTTPLHRAFARAITARGARARYKLKTGTADLNLLAPAWGCPALAYGPGDASLDHTPRERMPVEELLAGVGVLTDVLLGLEQEAPEVAAGLQRAPGGPAPSLDRS